MGVPLSKNEERRRHPRLNVKGSALIAFQGQTIRAGVCDVSRSGARLQIRAKDLFFKQNDRLVLLPKKGELAIAFICDVRHISIKDEDASSAKVYSIGLEYVASEIKQPDIVSLLLDTGTVTPEAEASDLTGMEEHDGYIVNLLRAGIRQSSQSRILGPLQALPLLREIPEELKEESERNWKVSIGIQSPAISIQFSTLYDLPTARSFLSRKKNSDVYYFDDRLCHDFMREFCNLTAGAMKTWIERHAGSLLTGKDLRVQLPNHSPEGSSEILELPSLNLATHVRDAWQLALPTGEHIRCIADITIWSWAVVAAFQTEEGVVEAATEEKKPKGDEDDIEFL